MSMLPELINLRHQLHQNPRCSGQEAETRNQILAFLTTHAAPDEVLQLGKTGLVVIYRGHQKGPKVLLRCELDALPIQESNTELPYQSVVQNVSHKCGHDGHMAIICGVAMTVHQQPNRPGDVMFCFQPAEETGQGAKWVLADPRFTSLQPDYVFALHNVPGYELGRILLRPGTITPASVGLTLSLLGNKSHASEPHLGRSPANAIAQLMQRVPKLTDERRAFLKGRALITLIYCRVGTADFGVSPGEGEIGFTIRAHQDEDVRYLAQAIVALAEDLCREDQLTLKQTWSDEFPSTKNDPTATEFIQQAAAQAKLSRLPLKEPFPWSEDFGHFTARYPGALFGLGAGKKQLNLHDPNYNFPDKLIQFGLNAFNSILEQVYLYHRHQPTLSHFFQPPRSTPQDQAPAASASAVQAKP